MSHIPVTLGQTRPNLIAPLWHHTNTVCLTSSRLQSTLVGMTQPRSQQVSVADTPFYHVVSRCVRRSFLCGFDRETGENYEHRRGWIEGRIRILSSIFAIDICAYAVMNNHYHIVVKLNPCEAEAWPDDEVLHRWCSLFKGMPLVQKYLTGKPLLAVEIQAVKQCVAVYRSRLQSLSWLMKCLNEPIARQANKEDGCTGHFWEARFKSQALFTEDALLSAMAYVDLNPVRACMADTPENSDFTSIKERIEPQFDLCAAINQQTDSESLRYFDLPLKPLAKFEGNLKLEAQTSIIFRAEDYLSLVDTTGRIIRTGKRGAINANLPPILERLNLDIDAWLIRTQGFEYSSVENIIHRSMAPAITVLVNPFTSALLQASYSQKSSLDSPPNSELLLP